MTLLANFSLDRPIGKGGMGEVWLGRHLRSGTQVAVKFGRRETWTPAQQAAFRHEAAVMARLNHPHIVQVHDFGEASPALETATNGAVVVGSSYVVMEFCRSTLRRPRKSVSARAIDRTVGEILRALAHAHARGIVHRDLKPSNILMARTDAGPTVKLADFGLAQIVDHHELREGVRERPAGTPPYMAPEQCTGLWRDFGPWTDIYALGCIVFELLAARPAFRGKTFAEYATAHCFGERPDLPGELQLSAGIRQWVATCLRQDPTDRFESAADALWAWERASKATTSAPQIALSNTESIATLDTAHGPVLPLPTEVVAPGGSGARSPHASVAAARPSGNTALPTPATWRDQRWARAALPDTGLGLFGLRELPPVGRDDERDRLWATLTEMAQGRSSVVVLRGGSGTGKSHLARWFREAAQECGVAMGVGARHYRETDGQCGLSEMLRRRMRLHGLNPKESWDRIQQHLAHAPGPGPLWLRCARLIAPRIDLEAAPFSTERERHLTLAECLDHLARGHGWIAQLDDAHWAPECFAFAQTMLSRRGACVVVLTVPRTVGAEVQRELDSVLERGAQLVELGPLTDGEMTHLVSSTLPLAQELRARIVATSSGNPHIATQTLANWVRAGRITSGTDGHHLVRTPHPPIARSAGQVAGWTSEQQLAVAALAALGPSVDRSEWHQICLELGVDVDGALETQLLEWGVLVPTYGGWQVAHASQLDELRSLTEPLGLEARCHAACARVLPTDTPEEKLRVARHCLEAGERADALRLMCLAAQTIFELGEETRAYRILEHRRAHLQGPEADADAAKLEMKCAAAVGDLAGARQWLDRARQLAPQNLRLAIGEVNLLDMEKNHERAAEVAQTLVERAHTVGDHAVEAIARAGHGTALARAGRFRDARRVLDQAVEFCRAHGADKALNLALSSRVVVAMNLGDNDAQCDADMEECIAVADRMGNLRNTGAKLILAGERERKRGNLDRARSLYMDAYERLQRVDAAAAGVAASNLVFTSLGQGNVQEASRWFAAAEPALDNEVFQDSLDLQRFAIHLVKGEPAEAYWQAQEKHREDWDLAWILEVAGRSALDGPNHALAQLALQRASKIWRSQGDIERANDLHRLLGVLDSGTLPMDLSAVQLWKHSDDDPV